MGLYDELYGEPPATPSGGGLYQSLYGDTPSEPIKMGADSFADTIREEMKNKDWATRNIIGAGSALTSAWEGIKGLVGKSDQSQVTAAKAMAEEAPVGRIAGEVAMLAPTLVIPGAATARGAAAIGGVTGAALTPGDWKERATSGVLGAAGGALGSMLSSGAKARPAFEMSDAAKAMQKEGVALTPGQNIGGFTRRLEDRLTSAPFVGDIIEQSRVRGIQDFNKAALRRAEVPGVASAGGQVGHEGIAKVGEEISHGYDTLLANASIDVLDPKFISQMTQLRGMVKGLPAEEARQFDNIIAREIDNRIAPNGILSQGNLQDAFSQIKKEAASFGKSTDKYQRELGASLKQVSAEMMDLVGRTNPQIQTELKALNKAYANLVRIEKAAGTTGAEKGVFTPSQLHGAVRAKDDSLNKRAFARGKAMMQDLSSQGKELLPSSVPDSGTAGRLMGSLFNPLALPGITAGAVASIPLSILYSRPGQEVVNALINKGIRPTAEAIRQALAQNPALAGIAAGRLSELTGQ